MTRPRRQKPIRKPNRNGDDPLHDAEHGIRLAKALAAAGVGSRRTCEQLIAEHRVAVNGKPITQMPCWVDPDTDRIEVDGRSISAAPPRGHTYLLMNKPRRVICTNADEFGRKTIFDLVPHKQRLFCVGRLDADSTGLVLLTDDGQLANRLMHPRYEAPKTYAVSIAGSLTDDQIVKLKRGIVLADKTGAAATSKADDVEIVDRDREKTRLRITLREGRNREIRRMLARLGHKVKRLDRIALGPLRLKGVASGEWRKLTRPELAALRKLAKHADA